MLDFAGIIRAVDVKIAVQRRLVVQRRRRLNNNRIFNIVSAGIAAVIAVSSFCIYECGSKNTIGLQSPSLLGAGKVDFFERQLMDDDEIAETGVVPMSLGNPNISINDYTFVAEVSFADVKIDYGNDPTDPITLPSSFRQMA